MRSFLKKNENNAYQEMQQSENTASTHSQKVEMKREHMIIY